MIRALALLLFFFMTSSELVVAAPTVRPMAVAGTWYPEHPKLLADTVDQLLANAKPNVQPDPGSIRAILVPHAGYSYSGATAATAYKGLKERSYRRVVVIGPAHHLGFTGVALPKESHFATPLGEIPLDVEALAGLRQDPLFQELPAAHEREHSIESQLPFLQRTLAPGWLLLPLAVGALDSAGYARVAERLRPLINGETLFVFSGDLTHYGPRFDYRPFPNDAKIADNLRLLDMGLFQHLVARDVDGLLAYAAKTHSNACALGPMVLMTHLFPTGHTVHGQGYATSGGQSGDYEHSVSYLAASMTAPPVAGALSDADLERLHTMAVQSLTLAVTQGTAVPEQIAATNGGLEPFRTQSGAFVTLKKGGELRGCIGAIRATQPLYAAVVDNAVNAALHDHRFTPVQPTELPALEVEVSVLSPLTPIASLAEFQLGKHGILLTKQGRGAVFLPEVALEQRWSAEETLTHLAIKAGLPPEAWKEGASFEVFTSQTFTAPYRLEPGKQNAAFQYRTITP